MNIAIYVYLYSLISYTSIIIFICYKKKIHSYNETRTNGTKKHLLVPKMEWDSFSYTLVL